VGEDKESQTVQSQNSHSATNSNAKTEQSKSEGPSSNPSPVQHVSSTPLSLPKNPFADSPGLGSLGKHIISPPQLPEPKKHKSVNLSDDDEDDELLWDKDLQRNVLRDADDDSDDIPDSQE